MSGDVPRVSNDIVITGLIQAGEDLGTRIKANAAIGRMHIRNEEFLHEWLVVRHPARIIVLFRVSFEHVVDHFL